MRLIEAGQDPAGPDLDERGRRRRRSSPRRRRPSRRRWSGGRRARRGSRRPVVRRPGVGVGEERRRRVAEVDRRRGPRASRRPPRPSAGSGRRPRPAARSRAWRRALWRCSTAASTAGRSPDTTTWPGRVAVRDAEHAVGGGPLDELGQAGVVEADDRRHPALAPGARTPASAGRGRGRGGRRRRGRARRRRRGRCTGPSSGRRRRRARGCRSRRSAQRSRTASR